MRALTRIGLLFMLLVARVTGADTLDRIAVVGASASAGFLASYETRNEFVRLAHVFDAALPETTTVTSHADWNFFTRPRTFGPALMDATIADDPTCVIAIDYLFWYSYGVMGPNGVMRTAEDRLALLELGLSQLERLECPVIVGDIPDMRDAQGFMLSSAQIPSVEAIRALNERLAAWASEREDVHVFPLDRMTSAIRKGEGVTVEGVKATAEEARTFINADKLHPTKQGQVFTARAMGATMATLFEDVSDEDFDFENISERLEEAP